jgi:hypothetical protein
MKASMSIGVLLGLALYGCAAEPPSGTRAAEISPTGPATPLVPQPSASVSVPRLPAGAYWSGPASVSSPSNGVVILPYHPSWTVDVWGFGRW